jgi:transcriptional regulator with XRE-family HTH domain
MSSILGCNRTNLRYPIHHMETRKRLAEILDKKRWTPSDLAHELGEHPHWVRDRLIGRIQIKADELPRIAEALGESPCAFFEEAQPSVADRLYRAVTKVLLEAPQERAAGTSVPLPSRPEAATPEEAYLLSMLEDLPEPERTVGAALFALRQMARQRQPQVAAEAAPTPQRS